MSPVRFLVVPLKKQARQIKPLNFIEIQGLDFPSSMQFYVFQDKYKNETDGTWTGDCKSRLDVLFALNNSVLYVQNRCCFVLSRRIDKNRHTSVSTFSPPAAKDAVPHTARKTVAG